MTKKAASPHRVAVVQHPPVTLHRQKTLERGVGLLEEAAAGGARLVSFPETWLPGYPEWIWRLRPAEDYALTGEIHGLLIENAVDLKAGDLKPIQTAARKLKVTVSIGIHERDGEYSRGTLYNTQVLIGPDGEVLNRHRKLMPTNPERMVWGTGDASGLRVSETPMRPHLLGELHAAGSVRCLCSRLRDLHRADVGRRQHVGFDHAAHRRRGPVLGVGQRDGDARQGHPERFSEACAALP
jgi:hypothetical protein